MKFEFYYEMADSIVYEEVKGDIRRMENKEHEYFEKYGKTLDKRKIPSGTRCNNENECCPYRKKQCVKDYPKGKDVLQMEVKDDE